ncbi:MAG TPA: hypothetical protein VHG91_08890 [Longimicrobium sp.]|nr:hypothetical protein [Longimicrobium sp.]
MGGETGGEDLHGRVLRAMVAAVPEGERAAALRRLLAALEAAHREEGVAPPAWISAVRGRLDA